jgi:uncharacterized protein
MAAAAMPLEELERWLQARVDQHPVATSIAMLDGYVTAIVAGPVSISPLEWICSLLAVDADAFNHGGTPEFAAISAVALRHNDISNILSTASNRFEPMHRRKPDGDVDPRPWCRGFYAAIRPRMSDWARCSIPATPTMACCCRSSCTVATIRGVRCSDRPGRAARPGNSCATPTPIFPRSSRRCANIGCRPATHAPADRLTTTYVDAHTGYDQLVAGKLAL